MLIVFQRAAILLLLIAVTSAQVKKDETDLVTRKEFLALKDALTKQLEVKKTS